MTAKGINAIARSIFQFFRTFRAVLGPTQLFNGNWWLFPGVKAAET
jgi:hypothetical protein